MKDFRILVVEDEPLVAEDIAGYLQDVGYGISAIAYNGNQALLELETNTPDAVLLDITLGGYPDGIDVAKQIQANFKIPFVFLTSHSDRTTLEEAKKTMPAAYLLKPFDENNLLTTLEVALYTHKNNQAHGEWTLETLNEKLPTGLSEREFEVMQHMCAGKTNKEISETVFLSVNTIKTHLLRIYQKLDVGNRTEAQFKLNKLKEV